MPSSASRSKHTVKPGGLARFPPAHAMGLEALPPSDVVEGPIGVGGTLFGNG